MVAAVRENREMSGKKFGQGIREMSENFKVAQKKKECERIRN